MELHEVEDLVEGLVQGRVKAKVAIVQLMNEMSRGHVRIVVDENIGNVADELEKLRYTCDTFPSGMKDQEVKQSGVLNRRILVTNDGDHFDFEEDMTECGYGLIWWDVTLQRDPIIIAKEVEKVIQSGAFEEKVGTIVKIGKDPSNPNQLLASKVQPRKRPTKSKRKVSKP